MGKLPIILGAAIFLNAAVVTTEAKGRVRRAIWCRPEWDEAKTAWCNEKNRRIAENMFRKWTHQADAQNQEKLK